MVTNKQGWILADAEFVQERELLEKIQEKKAEKKEDRKLNKLLDRDEQEDDEFTIFPEDLTPIYRQVRFAKKDVKSWMQSVDDVKITAVSMEFDETVYFLKCTIEEFDKVFFE